MYIYNYDTNISLYCYFILFKFNWKSAIFASLKNLFLLCNYLVYFNFYYCMAFNFGYIFLYTHETLVSKATTVVSTRVWMFLVYVCKENKLHNSILCYSSIMSVAIANVYNFQLFEKPFFIYTSDIWALYLRSYFGFLRV